jgi:SAM-dependent methyltransferase
VLTKDKTLYGWRDLVGLLLSAWRCQAVLPYVKGTLLDLACGDNRLVKAYGSGMGVDITPYKHVDIVHRDFSRLPFADKSLDTVTILAALNYFDHTVVVLQEIRRVLKDDGRLLVTFLNRRVSSAWHKVWERAVTPRAAFSEIELIDYLAQAGLRLERKVNFMFGVNCIYIIAKQQ